MSAVVAPMDLRDELHASAADLAHNAEVLRRISRRNALGEYEWRRNGGHLTDESQTPYERSFWRGVDAAVCAR